MVIFMAERTKLALSGDSNDDEDVRVKTKRAHRIQYHDPVVRGGWQTLIQLAVHEVDVQRVMDVDVGVPGCKNIVSELCDQIGIDKGSRYNRSEAQVECWDWRFDMHLDTMLGGSRSDARRVPEALMLGNLVVMIVT